MRVLSGIQPSGALHIGNYFGAIRQYVALQEGNDAFYFVAELPRADQRARGGDKLRKYVFGRVRSTCVSLGLDPERATLFVQSDVPETTELAWLLTSVTPMGWLEKCVSYKDKVQQGLPAEHGLFAYPVLQAADILLYDADLVPVGQDQKQHLEITRDIAERFNNTRMARSSSLPKPYILDQRRGRAGGRWAEDVQELRQHDRDLRRARRPMLKKAKKIVTDSIPVEEPKRPRHLTTSSSLYKPVRRSRAPSPRPRGVTARGASATAR